MLVLADKLVEAEELVMPENATYSAKVDLEIVNRPVGTNRVGIVSWLMTLRTPECPAGRQVRTLRPCVSAGLLCSRTLVLLALRVSAIFAGVASYSANVDRGLTCSTST